MRYEKVYKFIIPKLEHELPAHLTYHNSQHTKDAFRSAAHLCDAEHVSKHEKELLLTAVLFHDSGFLKTYEGHEEESCELAKKTLPDFDYTQEEIDTICSLIMATKMHHKPTTLLEKIIRDADLHYLGTHHYFSVAGNLYSEYLHHGFVKDNNDWHEKQLLFLHEHEYFTKAAIKRYGALKKKNMQTLAFRNKKGRKHISRAVAAIIDWGLIVIGALAAGFGLNGYLVPNDIFDGGVSGIALLINKIFGFDLSLLIILLNLPIIILSYFSAGRNFALKTTIGIVLLGVCVHFTHFLTYDPITKDKLLVSVFGGFFIGLGSGLAIRSGSVLDGSEFLAMQTIKRSGFTIC
jgi:HD superfamily phosphodiesterase